MSRPREGPLESAIQGKIMRWLRAQRDCYAVKYLAGRGCYVGVPDVLACVCGQAVYLEVKRPGEHPTPRQAAEHRKIRKRGGACHVVRSLHEVQKIVDEVRAGVTLQGQQQQ